MTELQFKSWLLQLLARPKEVKEERIDKKESKIEDMIEEFENILKMRNEVSYGL